MHRVPNEMVAKFRHGSLSTLTFTCLLNNFLELNFDKLDGFFLLNTDRVFWIHGVNSYGELSYLQGLSSPPGLVALHVAYPPPPPSPIMHPASGLYPPLSSCPVQISYQVSGLPPPCLPGLGFFRKKLISSRTTEETWFLPYFSTFFRKKWKNGIYDKN